MSVKLLSPAMLPEEPRKRINALFNLMLRPAASVTPANNGDLSIQATSNTSLTFKYKGSDGTVRSGSVTLS